MRRLLAALCVVAVSIAAQDSPRAAALIARAAKLEKAGRLDEAARDFRSARAEAERTGDRKTAAEAATELGYLLYYRGAMNEALVELQHGYDTYGAIGDVAGRRLALSHIAHLYADPRFAQYDRAIEYYRQLLGEYESAGAREDVADTLYNLGSTYGQKGDHEHALDWYRRALAAEKRLGRTGEIAYVNSTIGVALGKLGRSAEALPLFDDALRVFHARKETNSTMQVRLSRGVVLRQLGRRDAAITDLEAARQWFTSTKNTRFLEKTQDELAHAYADARRWNDAYRARTAHAALERELAVQRRDEHTARLRVQFDSEKKEQENRALLRDNAATARIRRLQTIILILGAIAIAVLLYLALRLRTTAMTDELTRLPNRRRILALAERALQRGMLSLLAIDIDKFKAINDTWGHAAGDLVLQRVAHTCRTALGSRNVVGRVGGEEFLAILPATPLAIAQSIAERLRAAVERLEFPEIDATLRVTISIGLTESQASESVSLVTRRADELLYRAKEAGRNRVVPQVAFSPPQRGEGAAGG